MDVITIKEMKDKGIDPEILFWVGCAGSFDDRALSATSPFLNPLTHINLFKGFPVTGLRTKLLTPSFNKSGPTVLCHSLAIMAAFSEPPNLDLQETK